MTSHRHILVISLATLAGFYGPGCNGRQSSPALDRPATGSISVEPPASINIVRSFTKWSNFDDQPGIDGVTLFVQPVDGDGRPTRAFGSAYVEIWQKRRAAGIAEGERIGIWDFPLDTHDDQAMRWRRAMRMYELPVALPASALGVAPGSAVIVSVTYHLAAGGQRFDEMELRLPLAQTELARQ